MKKRRKSELTGYLMIMPSYIVYLLFVLIPILVTIGISFTNYDLYKTRDFVGVANYIKATKDPVFRQAVVNTIIYAVFTIVPQIALGLLVAVGVNAHIPGKKFFRISFYLPYVTAMAAISMIWLWIYDPMNGMLNTLFRSLGFEGKKWLFDPRLAMPSVIVMSIWKSLGYNMIIYLSGLQQIPGDLYEAAMVDGANSVVRFFKITLPMLKPTTFFLIVTGTVASFSVFEQVNVLTGGGPLNRTTTIVHQIYSRAFTEYKMGYASAQAVVLLLIILFVTFLNIRYGNEGADVDV